MEAHQLSDALEQMSAQKTAFERDVTQIQNENQRLQVDNESLTAEKWELSAANADLQNRLQAVSYMQVSLSDFTKKKICTISISGSNSFFFRMYPIQCYKRKSENYTLP